MQTGFSSSGDSNPFPIRCYQRFALVVSRYSICGIVVLLALGWLPAIAVEPPVEPDHEFTFVVLGDSQFELPNTFNRLIDEIVHLYPSFVIQVGDIVADIADPASITLAEVEKLPGGEPNIVRCPDPEKAAEMVSLIEKVRTDQNSIGGVAEVAVDVFLVVGMCDR